MFLMLRQNLTSEWYMVKGFFFYSWCSLCKSLDTNGQDNVQETNHCTFYCREGFPSWTEYCLTLRFLFLSLTDKWYRRLWKSKRRQDSEMAFLKQAYMTQECLDHMYSEAMLTAVHPAAVWLRWRQKNNIMIKLCIYIYIYTPLSKHVYQILCRRMQWS